MDFLEWAKSITAEFSFYRFTGFHEHLVRRVQSSEKGITLAEYDAVWRVYARTQRSKGKTKTTGTRGSGRQMRSSWRSRMIPDGGDGGWGKGGKGRSSKGGGRGDGRRRHTDIADACYGNCIHDPCQWIQPWFPRQQGPPDSIKHVELFGVWWAVALWGQRMQGQTIVVRIDNQSAMYQVGSWWGPVEYLSQHV